MKFNFRQISALAMSALTLGMTAGVAAAANYPAPFVVGGSANVAVVYGTGSGVSALDAVQSGNIQTNLQSFMGAGTSGGSATTSGEVAPLDTSATRIWLNNSLNVARSSFTKTDLPNVLGDSAFSGNVDATLTHTIKFYAGTAAGSDNSNKVIFAKQPKSNDDPVLGISLGTSQTNPLYNASVTFKAINFTHADSEGETITLFGEDYVISTATDTTDLVLFSSAEQVTLTKTGATNPTATVNIGGTSYIVELINGDSTSATISIGGSSATITEGNSKKVGGIEVAVKDVISSDAGGITATLLVGSEKITFTDASIVTKGSDDDPVDGTYAYITGGTGAATALTIAVFRPDANGDAIIPGQAFIDPVFENFKIDFAGLSSNLDDAGRDIIEVLNSGDDTMSISLTDSDGNEGVIEFAHNQSGHWRLLDDNNYTIHVQEMANVTIDEFLFIGNEDYGHMLQLYDVYNSSNGDHTKHRAKFQDAFSGTTYETTFTSDTTGTVIIDGKTYTVTLNDASGGVHAVQVKYPTSDSASETAFVLYPTIKTQKGALVSFYEPLTISLHDFDGTNDIVTLNLPDGDGYTAVTFNYLGNLTYGNWTVDSTNVITVTGGETFYGTGQTYKAVTVGKVVYNFTTPGTVNVTTVYLVDPEGNGNIPNPGILIFEEKDDNNAYEAIFVDLENDPAGTSNNGVGVEDVLFSTEYGHYSATLSSDSDITHDVDWYGTLVTTDSSESDQKTVTIAYPDTQVYAQIYLGELSATVTGGGSTGGATQLGDVLVKDTEVSSVSSKNLIVVGGSCINSVAANLVGGATCGSSWTDATGVGSGQFLIQSFGDKYAAGKVALLVAGYEAADTVNAATYLRTQTVDTTAGKKYLGTSATSAQLVVQ